MNSTLNNAKISSETLQSQIDFFDGPVQDAFPTIASETLYFETLLLE